MLLGVNTGIIPYLIHYYPGDIPPQVNVIPEIFIFIIFIIHTVQYYSIADSNFTVIIILSYSILNFLA